MFQCFRKKLFRKTAVKTKKWAISFHHGFLLQTHKYNSESTIFTLFGNWQVQKTLQPCNVIFFKNIRQLGILIWVFVFLDNSTFQHQIYLVPCIKAKEPICITKLIDDFKSLKFKTILILCLKLIEMILFIYINGKNSKWLCIDSTSVPSRSVDFYICLYKILKSILS